MKEYLKFVKNARQYKKQDISYLDEHKAAEIKKYHDSYPQHSTTPLRRLSGLAEILGVKDIYVKDESFRMGLNAFKVLGGSYAIAKQIFSEYDLKDEFTYQTMMTPEIRKKIQKQTFISTTDGNHGRGVAWVAKELGAKCIIHMPKGTAKERLEHIQKLNAFADITEYNYDDSVRMSAKEAEENGYTLIQDTAWEGYENIPNWIIQGYTTMAYEAFLKVKNSGKVPTHILVQAGVGSLATAVTGFFSNVYKENPPNIIIVEPNKADCIYQTAYADDGTIHTVEGDMNTIMAGLACGEPCTVGWPILSDYADYFVSCPDFISAKGMRILANPVGEDDKIISGESGAVTTGLIAEIMMNDHLKYIREEIGLSRDSVVLCFSTEGDTDQKGYQNIVWDGMYPSI